ncbi:MAG: hypothetical protein WAN74_05175 [Thermoplasmata archaeon]
MALRDFRPAENVREGSTTHDELHYKTVTLEAGSGYLTLLIFLEMPGTHHRGLSIERDGATLAKGVIANHVRGLGLPNVEMAIAPPSNSNAILMVRLTGPTQTHRETLDRIVEEVRSFLKSQHFEPSRAPSSDSGISG